MMLECAFAQGSGKAAYELGLTFDSPDGEYVRALKILHQGVRLGSEKSANYLFGSFDDGDPLVDGRPDSSRARRYKIFGDALYTNPFLKFPNLDKVLPLPPAPLPKWDGNKQTLIDAAKAVVPPPVAPSKPEPSPASQRTGRAHIPQIELFDRTRPGLTPEDGRIQFHYLGEPMAQMASIVTHVDPRVAQGVAREAMLPEPLAHCVGSSACPVTGIWQARLSDDHPMAAVFNEWHRQSYMQQGHPFPDPREMHLDIEPAHITWTWWNQANGEKPAGIAHVGVGNPSPEV